MFQFSIRILLLGTGYFAVGFAISAAFGFESFLWLNLLFLHVAAICILAVGAHEYSGYQKRFCIAALVVEILFLIWIVMNAYRVDEFYFLSIVGFAASYFAGLMSASAYRAIKTPNTPGDSWRPLDSVTRLLVRMLPAKQDSETDPIHVQDGED